MVVFSDLVVGAGRGAAQVPQGDWLRGTISAAVKSSDSAFKCAYFRATCRHARIFEGVEMTMPSSEPPTKSIAAPPQSIPLSATELCKKASRGKGHRKHFQYRGFMGLKQ